MQSHIPTPVIVCATAQEACDAALAGGTQIPINLFGFSGQGYEAPGFDDDLRERLGAIAPGERSAFVLITGPGAGGSGIDRAAQIAKEMGFKTVGVVSDAIMEYGSPNDPAFDVILVVESSGAWGGVKPESARKDTLELSISDLVAVSQAMVLLGTRPGARNISYGGGVVGQQECCALANAGGMVTFVPCQINRAKAIAKAAKNGAPMPTRFDGEFFAFLHECDFCYPGITVEFLGSDDIKEPVALLIAKMAGVLPDASHQSV